jgi:hypothetical protein
MTSSPHPAPDVCNPWSRLSFAAWLCVAIHLVAGIAMATILRSGLETNPDLTGRLWFLAYQQSVWVAAWLTWNASALAILYFYLSFSWAHRMDVKTPAAPLRMAVMLTTAAVAADLSAEAIHMVVLPDLARGILDDMTKDTAGASIQLFQSINRVAVMLTGFLANGLYTISALLLICPTRNAYPRWTWIAGLLVGVGGIGLSVAALINSVAGMVWSNVVLVPAIVVWQVGVAVTAGRRGRE